MIFVKIISVVIGILGFAFLFWKRMREDYIANQIFSTILYMIIGFFFSAILASYFAPLWWFWLDFTGLILGLIVGIRRFKLKTFEALEAFVFSSMFFMVIYFFIDFIVTHKIGSIILTLVGSFLIIFFLLLEKNYKKIIWYKSGKIGFTGLAILGLFFLIRGLVALYLGSMISFVGRNDTIISGLITFIAFSGIFFLSRSQS